MRKLQILIIIFSFIFCGCASTGKIKSFSREKDISQEKSVKTISKTPVFFTGKRFTYAIAWNGIPVGQITAEIGDIKEYRGDDVYPVLLKTKSNKFLSKIYRVEDIYTSYISVSEMMSRRYEADRKEGNYRKHVIVEYDYEDRKATYTNLTDGSVKYCEIKDNVQDPVSAMCYFMSLPVNLNDKINITVNLNEKNYELYGKIESLDVIKLPDLGSSPAFRVRPYAVLDGEHVKKGRGYMYFAASRKRYPIYGVLWIPFGKVTATLRAVENI